MRAAAALLLLLAWAAPASPVPPPPRPEIEQRCTGPLEETQMRNCFARVQPRAKLTQTAPSVISALMPDKSTYVLIGAGTRWRIAFHQWDQQYDFLGATALDKTTTRVDIMHHQAIGPAQVLVERMTIICQEAGYCRQFTTACTMLDHGRTTGMFRLVVSDDGTTVSGDKSYAGDMCGGR